MKRVAVGAAMALFLLRGLLIWHWLTLEPDPDPRIVRIPETRVGLIPPPGFKLSEVIPGVVHPRAGLITVRSYPSSHYDGMKERVIAEWSKSKPLSLTHMGRLKGFSGEHFYYRGRYDWCMDRFNCSYDRWPINEEFNLVLRRSGRTFKIAATIPQDTLGKDGVTVDAIEVALASVVITRKPAPKRRLFDFKIDYLGPFSETRKDRGRKWFELTPPGQAFFLAMRSHSNDIVPDLGDPVAYSHLFLKRPFAALEDIVVEQEGSLTLGGLPGFVMAGTAHTKDSRNEVMFMQWVLIRSGKRFIRLYGQAPIDQRDKYWAEFPRIVESFRLLEN